MHIRGGLFPANIVERFIRFRVGLEKGECGI